MLSRAVEVTISLSDTFSHNQPTSTGKRIKVVPIELIKQNPVKEENINSKENSYPVIQEQLQAARQELQQLEEKKKQMISEAQAVIAHDQAEWERTRESYIKQAQEEGYQDGFAAGKQESMEQHKQLLEKANQIVRTATTDYHAKLEQSEETIVDLAIHTAEKIINEKLTEDPTSFLSIVKAAIKEIKDQSTVTVYVHPENYEFVIQHRDELVHLLHADTALTIYVNEELAKSGCVIEHPFGKIDASIDTQLQQLQEILHELALENEQ